VDVLLPIQHAIGNPLADALPFDVRLTSSDPQFEALVDLVIQRVDKPAALAVLKPSDRRVMKVILGNLLRLHPVTGCEWLSYSRDKNCYRIPRRYNPCRVSYTPLIRCVDALVKAGLCESKKGFRDRTRGKGYQSRLRSTDALKRLLEAYRAKGCPAPHRHLQSEPIELKDKDKVRVDYPETRLTRQMRRNLERINGLLAKTKIELPGAVPPVSDVRLYRVFNNGSFTQGGRFYGGWWQDVPESERERILLDGQPTVERDFSGMHLKMLYQEEAGIDYTDDPYALPGHPEEIRKALKKVLLVCLSATSRRAATSAILKDMQENPADYPEGFQVKPVLDALLKKHSPIAGQLFDPSLGVKLQNLDASIAEEILLEFVEKGIPILSIHDSFIVPKEHDDLLRATMSEVFERRIGVTPTVMNFSAWLESGAFDSPAFLRARDYQPHPIGRD
jgi:hypothetical protein